jgi:hypothetical protein
MVGAGQQAFALAGFGNDDRAAMAADIVEDADHAIVVAQQHQGHAGQFDGAGIALFGHIVAEARQHPGTRKEALVLQIEPGRVGVAMVRQAPSLLDRCVEAGERRFIEQGSV